MKPSPKRIDVVAHTQNAACVCHANRYRSVDIPSVIVPSIYDARLPMESATTPVGTSKITCPTVKNALAANACVFVSPASSKKRVFIPQMNDDARVESNVRRTYTR